MKKDILFKKLREGIDNQDYLILQQFCEIAENEYPDENETVIACIAFAKLNWNNAKVVELTTQLCLNNPDNAEYQLDLVEAYFKNYQNEEAVTLLDKIISRNANDENVQARYAKLIVANLSDEPTLKKAIIILNKIIAKYPNAPEPLLDRALAYQNISLNELAIEDLQRAHILQPDNEDVLQKLITVCQYESRSEEVQKYYEILLAISPENANYLIAYADFWATQEKYEKALEIYTQAIELELSQGFDATHARRTRGEVYLKNKQSQAAIADFTAALQNFNDSSIRLNRARAYQQSKNEKAFLADIKTILDEKDFYYADALLLRIDFYIENKDWAKAEKDAKALLNNQEYSFQQKDAYFALGKIAHGKNDLKKAAENWRKAADLHHSEADEMLNTYCQSEIQAEAEARKANLLKKFAGEATKNQQSAILTPLFGKIWVLDSQKTISDNPAVAEMPQALVGFFLEAFKTVNIQISPEMIAINNPNSDSLEAYYRIVDENEQFVQIYGEPTANKEARELRISTTDDRVKITGLMSQPQPDAPSLDLYFKEGSLEQIQPLDEKAQAEQMKNLAESFLTGLLQTVVEGIENASSPDGEAASDESPSDLQHD